MVEIVRIQISFPGQRQNYSGSTCGRACASTLIVEIV